MTNLLIFGASAAKIVRYILLAYLCIISVVSVFFCIKDKLSAKNHKRRVPESDLLLLSALGGSLFMLLTMLVIRHKTQKPKFMIGIPCILFLHFILAYLILV